MAEYVTLRERKEAKVAAIKAGVEELVPILTDYARSHGGRFILYGSAARGDVRYDSDVDILADFPVETEFAAMRFAEDKCGELGVTPDLMSWSFIGDRLRKRALQEGRILG